MNTSEYMYSCMAINTASDRMILEPTRFEWDTAKDLENRLKDGVAFGLAQFAFADPKRVIAKDLLHSETEERFYCFGKVEQGVLTVRFTHRNKVIRIIGAGYWRKGKAVYEQENQIHHRKYRPDQDRG